MIFFFFLMNFFQQGAAGLGDLAVGEVEFAGVPWVGDFSWTAGEVEQTADLILSVGADDPFKVADVVVVHYDDVIVICIFRPGYLMGAVAFARDSLFMEEAFHRRVDVIPEFFCRGRRGSNLELFFKSGVADHLFHHEFRHRRPAYIAVADKKYLLHLQL